MTTESDLAAQRRAAERAAARRLHPDVGGDADQYVAEMKRIAQQFGDSAGGEPVVTAEGFVRSRHVARIRRAARRTARGARAAVPSGWPGARKYGQL
ncbi:hypothetical protein [Demetria terragena]|uniref:hypothetical protein n=1 Tax=Demetria terragena TaxID=63959 RepID=UPI000372C1DD|nr:hypothetical protein [Demetria terragena]